MVDQVLLLQRLAKIPNQDSDWAYLYDRALKEKVSCLIYKSFSETGCSGNEVPGEIWKKLERRYYATAGANVLLYHDLADVLNCFNATGIPAIVLKGAYLAEAVYGNIALRPVGDIDILIKKENLPEIDRELGLLGFSSPYSGGDYDEFRTTNCLNSIVFVKSTGQSPTTLHLHWHIVNSTVPVRYAQNMDMDRLWGNARKTTIAGVDSLALAPHHLLIHLTEHLLRHSFRPLLYFCDISSVIKFFGNDLDWETLVRDTLDFDMKKPVYYGLHLTSRFTGAHIPDGVLQRLEPEHISFAERRILKRVEENRTFPNMKYFSYLLMNETAGEKLRFAARSIFPSRNVLALRHGITPRKVTFLHYLGRLWNGVERSINTLRG